MSFNWDYSGVPEGTGYDFTPSDIPVEAAVDVSGPLTTGLGDVPFEYGQSGDYGSFSPALDTLFNTYGSPVEGIQSPSGALQIPTETFRQAGNSPTVTTGGGSGSNIGHQLRGLVMDKSGENIDLTKIMKIATGLGGLYQAAQARKAAQGMSPAQLQAQLVQNNTQWTPAQALAANRFFNQAPNRGVVRAGEGGTKSIVPSRGYAGGGGVSHAALQELIDAYSGGSDEGVVPLASGVPTLSAPQGGGRLLRVHGGDMADGGMAGPLSHGDYGLVGGEGDGQSDNVQINVSPGEYVFDAETVSMLGNGSNDAGADILDQWREFLREHKRSAANDEIGPESRDPNEYLPGEE